jgi:hypothetical protein
MSRRTLAGTPSTSTNQVQAGGALHGQYHQREDGDPEDTEQRATRVAGLHERVEQHAAQLIGEQDRGGLSPKGAKPASS